MKYLVIFIVIYNFFYTATDYFKLSVDLMTDMLFLVLASSVASAFFITDKKRFPSEKEQKILLWGYILAAWITPILYSLVSVGHKPFLKMYQVLFPEHISVAIIFAWMILFVVFVIFIIVQYVVLNWAFKLLGNQYNKIMSKTIDNSQSI